MNAFWIIALLPLQSFASSVEEIAARIAQTYDPKIEVKLVDTERSFFGCKIENYEIIGQDPILRKNRTVKVALYGGKNTSGKVVLILPPTGGVNILDKGYSNEICKKGISAALVYGWDYQDENRTDLELHNEGALRALAAARHVVEFLVDQNHSRIGMLGTSIGAITGSLVLGFENRITAATLIVGSGRFADVIVESDEASAKALRKERMKKYGLSTLEEYRKLIREHVWVEPALFLKKTMSTRVFTITADDDKTVPTVYQLELNQQVNLVQHFIGSGDHVDVIKKTFFSSRDMVTDFFVKEL